MKGVGRSNSLVDLAARVPSSLRRQRERVFLFAKYAQRITACRGKSVNSIIECGRMLIAAKNKLKHGEFLKDD